MVLAGCSVPPIELAVSIRSNLEPGTDFTGARVELFPIDSDVANEVRHVDARRTDPFALGVLVANFANVPAGRSRVRASLLDARGQTVLARFVELSLEESYALTVVLNADCLGRHCPGSSEPPSYTECLSGRCVEPRCGGPIGGGCGELACETQNDCQLDCVAACVEGACVCVADVPDAGPPADTGPPRDSGPCPGECKPGDIDEEVSPCGCNDEGVRVRSRVCGEDCRWGAFSEPTECSVGMACVPGESENRSIRCGNCGMKTQTRTCTESCTWGAWTDTSSCENEGVCTPGATRSRSTSCGNCGTKTQTRTCTESCTWGAWTDASSCGNQGVCSPGATRAGSCDPCSQQTCTNSCTWGSCKLKPGNQCEHRGGRNYRCCGTGLSEFCLSSCRWSGTCSGDCTSCDC